MELDREYASLSFVWPKEKPKESPIGPLINTKQGEYVEVHSNDAQAEAHLVMVAQKLGFGLAAVPNKVLNVLWSRRTIYTANPQSPELPDKNINEEFVRYSLLWMEQSVGTTCAKYFLYHYYEEGKMQEAFGPTPAIMKAISAFDNERLVIVSCLDEVFYGRPSSLRCNERCSICRRQHQHWTNTCYWYWDTIKRDAVRKEDGDRCAGCDIAGCNIGRKSHQLHSLANPDLHIEACNWCRSWTHRHWLCNSDGHSRWARMTRMRLLLSAYVTRAFTTQSLRNLLNDYCDKHGLPHFDIPQDATVHRPAVPYF